jgi:hypothetical protein
MERLAPIFRDRNWLALAGLWVALVTWLILIGSVVAAASFASEHVFSVTGWVALGFGTAALILAVGGITMICTRGETACAVLALVLVLALTTFSSPLLFYGTFGE